MILGIDCGTGSFGYALVRTADTAVTDLGALIQEPDKSISSTLDRSLRTRRQVELVDSLCTHVTAIVHEEASYNPRVFLHNVNLSMCIGALVTYAWCAGIPVYQIPPKRWQQAITGKPGKVDYDDVYRRVEQHVARWQPAMDQLSAIKPRHRNHALDAAGIALCHAIDPTLATRVR